ncbi:Txe/YoeB family addiction module toxin [Jannaschia formosa]|uniref:Txe/YoeB family addiction module toxin n=1 Tax=Jannaschia formosa TaxID=2259592 RepID=UPI000E1BADCE|nr:Txe/YoeB family addiction module toxin [Jannaschia formosa]
MKLTFADRAWEDYLHWQRTDPKVLRRVNALLKEAMRTPFEGTGKPEPLRGDLSGWWSRRITREHRLVYRVVGSGEAQGLEVAQVRYHYSGAGGLVVPALRLSHRRAGKGHARDLLNKNHSEQNG